MHVCLALVLSLAITGSIVVVSLGAYGLQHTCNVEMEATVLSCQFNTATPSVSVAILYTTHIMLPPPCPAQGSKLHLCYDSRAPDQPMQDTVIFSNPRNPILMLVIGTICACLSFIGLCGACMIMRFQRTGPGGQLPCTTKEGPPHPSLRVVVEP
jgi:hypothetical protein